MSTVLRNIAMTASRAEIADLMEKQHQEIDRLRRAIQNCVEWSNGRECEWGDRAENAFGFLYSALAEQFDIEQ